MEQQNIKAFVAGATGYVGREVVRLLAATGDMTIAHVRPDSSRGQEWRERFGSMGANVDETPWEPDAMKATLGALKVDVVFSLLGTTRKRAHAESIQGDAYDRIDYGLTALLHDACLAQETRPKFVYLSAIGVSDRPRGTSRLQGNYMRARSRAESLIRGSGISFVIARPAVITGADRDEERPAERAAGVLIDGGLALLGALGAKKLKQKYRSTTNTTLAAALVRLAKSNEKSAICEGDELR